MISPTFRSNLKFVAAMSIGARRHMDMDEPTIRREAMKVASEAVTDNIDDQMEQESVIAAFGREIDAAIARSR
jgi:hypothetical protein